MCLRSVRVGLLAWMLCAVTASSSAHAQRLQVAVTPRVRIGASEAQNALLTAVVGSTRMPDGRIVVANRGDHALLEFDAQGTLKRQLIRKGRGPGEVDYLLYFMRCGTSLYVGDVEASRTFELGADLAVRRTFRFAGQTYRRACNASGHFVHMGWERSTEMRGGPFRATAPYWVSGPDSLPGKPLGTLAGSERFGVTNAGKIVGTGPLVLGREPSVAIGPQAAYVALADSLHILAFGLDGTARPALRAPSSPIRSSAGDVEAAIEVRVAQIGEQSRSDVTREYRAMPRPATLPATREILVDATGAVWVQRYPSAGAHSVSWTVFAPTGGVLATIALPTALTVHEIGRDYVLGLYVDADTGQPEVRLYTLTR